MVTEREWIQLHERLVRIEHRLDAIAEEQVETRLALVKTTAWTAFAPWIASIVIGLAGLGAWIRST